MKMVLVFDTEDFASARNSLLMAQHFFKVHHESRVGESGKVSFTKIPMIKLVRRIARGVENNKLDSNLRNCKKYVDDHWIDWQSQGR